jgi:hypothetical protein
MVGRAFMEHQSGKKFFINYLLYFKLLFVGKILELKDVVNGCCRPADRFNVQFVSKMRDSSFIAL